MVIVILSYIYIFMICLFAGVTVREALSKFIPVPKTEKIGITGIIVSGLVALTVYAEFFSIFYKIGAICHIIMLMILSLGAYKYRRQIGKILISSYNRAYIRFLCVERRFPQGYGHLSCSGNQDN